MLEGTTENVAVSTPSSSGGSGNVTSGTATDAMIKAATAASSAEESATTPDASAGAIPPGATSDARGQPKVTGATVTSGEAPVSRIEAAVKNARAEARAAVEAQYAWAKDVDPQDVQVGGALLYDLRTNAKQFLQELAQELGATLSFGTPTAETVETVDEAFPAPDLVSPDGRLKTYSDATLQKMLHIHGRKVAKELRGEMAPMLEFVNGERETRAEQGRQQQVVEATKSALAEARKLPHFTKENEPLIAEKLKAIDPSIRRQVGSVAALYIAYNQMLSEKVFPTIETAAEVRVQNNNSKKAAASVGAHPVDQGGEAKKPVLRGVDDLAKHMERLAQAATA